VTACRRRGLAGGGTGVANQVSLVGVPDHHCHQHTPLPPSDRAGRGGHALYRTCAGRSSLFRTTQWQDPARQAHRSEARRTGRQTVQEPASSDLSGRYGNPQRQVRRSLQDWTVRLARAQSRSRTANGAQPGMSRRAPTVRSVEMISAGWPPSTYHRLMARSATDCVEGLTTPTVCARDVRWSNCA
jgi:uncharacterized caspase-like protein